MEKYKFTGETKTIYLPFGTVTLHRIKAVVEFRLVKVGDLGGWIEKEENLSHEENAWVYGNAKVYGDAWVCGNAKVYGDAKVCGNAEVYGNAKVYGDAWVCGNAKVYGDAKVCGNAEVYGDAKVYGDAEVCGNAWICGSAKVFSTDHVLVIGAIGSRNDFTTFFRDKDNEITVKCGCFLGKIDKFLEKVTQTHKDTKHTLAYRTAVEVAKLQIDLTEKSTRR